MPIWTETWQFWAAMAAVFAAFTAIFAKVGVDELNPDVATFLRTLVVAVVLGLVLAATRRFEVPDRIPVRGAGFLILSGLATGASWICYFRALKLGNASQVVPVDKLSVVLVAIFGALFLGEHLSASSWLGVALIASGAILVALG
ncbi:EamA family transporter [Tropicimonas sp.]|uniref:EamA family transporter n=1 Tax=Tropicimonas sp. TaxID=2067044 RepID=UPI003A83DB1B